MAVLTVPRRSLVTGKNLKIFFTRKDNKGEIQQAGLIHTLKKNGTGKGVFYNWFGHYFDADEAFTFGEQFLRSCEFYALAEDMLEAMKQDAAAHG